MSGRVYAKPVNRPPRDSQNGRLAMGSSSGLLNNWPPFRPSRQILDFQGILASESLKAHFPSQNSPGDMTPELRDPVSTIEGRSGFFATPNPRRSIEVRLPLISPRVRAEHHRVSDAYRSRSSGQASGSSRSASVVSRGRVRTRMDRQEARKPAAALNLNRFLYGGRGLSTVGVPLPRNPGRHEHERQPKKATKTGRVAKPAIMGKKPRARGARDEKMRDRSSFARAVHHFRRKAGNA